MSVRRFLAVTHEASITGAPMNLLHLVRWISTDTDTEIHTLCLQDGPLRSSFESVGDVTVLDRSTAMKVLGTVHRGLLHLGSSRAYRPFAAAHMRPQLRHLRDFDLVYLNSLPSAGVLPYLGGDSAVVSHVHELQVAFRTWRAGPAREHFLNAPDLWVAASGAVRDMLVNEVRLPEDRVALHHEFIDAGSLSSRSIEPRVAAALRMSASITDGAAVVVGAGTLEWRKGPELFVQLATEVARRGRDRVVFVWVGGSLEGVDWERVRSDADRSGADVRFVGLQRDPYPWFALADVFALTSHEDPYPLVCLECAALGTPVVTYRNGGIPEFLDRAGPSAARGVAEHLDVGGLADRVLDLLTDQHLHRAAVEELRSSVLTRHDVSVAAPALYDDLVEVCSRTR